MPEQWSWYVNGNRQQPPAIDETAVPPTVPDDMLQRIVKMIPVEVIGAYTAAEAFGKTLQGNTQTQVLVGLFVLGLVGTWAAIRWLRGVSWGSGKAQMSLGILAFAVWVFVQGGWFEPAGYWNGAIAGIVAVIFAFILLFFPISPPAET